MGERKERHSEGKIENIVHREVEAEEQSDMYSKNRSRVRWASLERQRDMEGLAYLFLSFVYSTALKRNKLYHPSERQGRAGQLCSIFILFPQNERYVLSPTRARLSHWAQNPLTRTEQGSTSQPLIRMTKLYCFHTNTHDQTKTHTWPDTQLHTYKIKMRKALFLSTISFFMLWSVSHIHEYTEVLALFSLKFTSTQELWKMLWYLYCTLFSMTSHLNYICFWTYF